MSKLERKVNYNKFGIGHTVRRSKTQGRFKYLQDHVSGNVSEISKKMALNCLNCKFDGCQAALIKTLMLYVLYSESEKLVSKQSNSWL